MTTSTRNRPRRLRIEALEDRSVPAAVPGFVAAPHIPVVAGNTTNVKPVDVVAADFNGDGKPDVATANQNGDSVSVLIGNGNGTFKPAAAYAVGDGPAAVRAVDINRDGKLDLVSADQNADTITVLLGTGTGAFRLGGHYAVGDGPIALAARDFNGDGKVDLAVANHDGDTVSLLLGNAAGTLTAAGTVAVGTDGPMDIAVADFNGDGKPDIATVSGGFGHLDVNLNTTGGAGGTPSFAAKVNYPTGFVADTIVAGDFNHDGQPDLAVGCVFPSGDGVSLLVGNPDGTFQPFAQFSPGNQSPTAIAAADLDGDGNLDLVTANGGFGNNSTSVLLGDGAAGFATGRSYVAGQVPAGIAVADFNLDGVPDVVTADSGGPVGTVSLLKGNGNGTLRASPNLTVQGPGPMAAADFTGDNRPDLAIRTSFGGYTGVAVYPNHGNGTFDDPVYSPQVDGTAEFAAKDVNGDGTADLAIATGAGVTVLLGNGDASFAARHDYALAKSGKWVAIADFLGDAKPDLAVLTDNGVYLLAGNGDGTFAAPVLASATAGSTMATGDFNGDGKPDLAVGNNGVSILINGGGGSFNAPTAFTNTGADQVAVGDLTGDGKPDVAASSFIPGGVGVYQNTGGGVFGFRGLYDTDSNPQGLTIGDYTGDGKPDVAVANEFSDTLTVLPNGGTGTLGAPIRYVIGDFPEWVASADFNGDGRLDLAATNSNSGTVTLLETPTAASSFRVHIVPAETTAGAAFSVVVSALDAGGRLADDFVGPVTFTSSDPKAVLPPAYTFTAADGGVHTFTVTLKTAGEQNLTARSGGALGTDSVIVDPAAANKLRVVPADQATAGDPFDVTVSALDPFGNVAPTYTGTVHLSTTDTGAGVGLPADYTFTDTDLGTHTFAAGVTLVTAGPRTVSARPTTGTWPLASGTVNIVGAAAAALDVTSPDTATAGLPLAVTVTARDPYGNVADGYAGTVHLTSSDAAADLPADYTFVAGDKGVHVLQPVLRTGGLQSVTVDAPGLTTGVRAGITVVAGAAGQLAIDQGPSNTFPNTKIVPPVTVRVSDAFGNPVGAGVKVTLALGANPTGAHLAGATAKTDATGLATFPAATASKPGVGYTLVAKSGTGTSDPSAAFTVYKATKFGVVVSGPTEVAAGTAVTVTVTALAGSVADPTYVGTVHFSSTAGVLADLPADATFLPTDNGVKQFAVIVKKAGAQTVTVADTLKPTVKGTAKLTIDAGLMTGFVLSGPTTVPHNVAKLYTVTAADQFGNAITTYAGTVTFGNTGGTAVLPAPYTFQASDKGKHTIKVTFQTPGPNQTLTVADQADGALVGELDDIAVT